MTQQTLLRELVSAFAKHAQLTGFSQERKRRKNLERFTNLRVILALLSGYSSLLYWDFGILGFWDARPCIRGLDRVFWNIGKIQDGGFTTE